MYLQKIIISISFVSLAHITAQAQDSSFIFTTNSRENYFPTYIGNGIFSLASMPLGNDAVAKKALEIAVDAAKTLKVNYNKKWETLAKKMYIPFDPDK